MVGVVAVDALVILKGFNLFPDHGDLLLQNGQDDVGIACGELVGQVTELEAHLGIPAADLHLDGRAVEMLDGIREPRHLQGLLVPQDAPELSSQRLGLHGLLFEALSLKLYLLSIGLLPGLPLLVVLLLGFPTRLRRFVDLCCLEASLPCLRRL